MDTLAVFGLVWAILLVLILPAIAPVEYATAENGRDAYILTPPEQIQQGDTIQYWDNGTQSFRLSTVRRPIATGYVVTAPPESGQNTTIIQGYTVVGTPVTIAGEPLTIPFAGVIVPFVQAGGSLLIVAFFIVSVVIGAILRERVGTHRRKVLRVRHVVLPLLLSVVLSTLVISPITASTYQIAYEAGERANESTDEEWTEQRVTVRYRKPLVSHLVVETSTDDLLRWRQDGQVVRADLRVPTAGPYTTTLNIFPYLAVLPRSIVRQLHAIHPVLAVIGTSAVVTGPLLAIYGLFVDGTKPAPRLLQTVFK